MRKTTLATMLLLGSVLAAGGAFAADPVAGWSFSQYGTDGQLTIDGNSFVDTLDANYSSLVPLVNAGPAAGSFGTMFADGSFGSSAIDPSPGNSPLIPTAGIDNCDRTPAGGPVSNPDPEGCTAPNVDGPIRSNKTGTAPVAGTNPFDSLTLEASQGQQFTNLLGLTADSAVSVVFQGDLTKVGGGSDWELSLGARTFSGTSTVTVDFSLGCAGYSPAGSLAIDEDDEVQSLSFPAGAATTACVRLNFPSAASGQAIIDNVVLHAVPVPEPGVAIGLMAGLGWLRTVNRRRSRS